MIFEFQLIYPQTFEFEMLKAKLVDNENNSIYEGDIFY